MLPQETWLDKISLDTEAVYTDRIYANVGITGKYNRFYLTIGKNFDMLSTQTYYKLGYRLTLKEMIGMIK